VPSPGKYPLVVDPIIGNVRLTKVLIDGGSSLNIIYVETLGADRSIRDPGRCGALSRDHPRETRPTPWATRALVGNAFRQGFYWPTVVADATRIVRTCQGCQFYARQTHLSAQALLTIPITWPFAVWGLDLVRPLQKAPRGFTHLLVAIDKFSKWIEVRPLNSIRSEQAVAFFTNIIHRFGVPNSIITDNGTQFTGRKFLDFCEDHHIRVDWAAVVHPMTNEQVERANDMILPGLKPRIYNDLNRFGRRWMKELPSVVWSLRTTPS
jgi:transposase InsO family protein